MAAATLEKPKTRSERVSDDLVVVTATQQLADVRRRRDETQAALEKIRQSPADDRGSRAAIVLSGQKARDFLTEAATLERELADLDAACQLAEQQHRTATQLATNRLRDSARPELLEHAKAVVDAVADAFSALEQLGEFIDASAARGASVPGDEYAGLLCVPGLPAGFRLPRPGQQLETIRREYADHIARAFGRDVAVALEQ